MGWASGAVDGPCPITGLSPGVEHNSKRSARSALALGLIVEDDGDAAAEGRGREAGGVVREDDGCAAAACRRQRATAAG
jgi:hypothetical protein